MPNWKSIRQQVNLLTVRVGALLWVHPRIVALCVLAINLVVFRHLLWRVVPVFAGRVVHPIYLSVQAHPTVLRIEHVLFNSIPDVAFALLAVAGLGYLVPNAIKNLEKKTAVRIFLMTIFVGFGLTAIIINAVNREDQEHHQTAQDDRMGTVMKSVLNIQESLKPGKSSMSESERREHLAASLRDEFILSHDPVDPDIITGIKMPPDDWMNKRLAEMNEKWTLATATPQKSQPMQITQVLSPPEKQAKIAFSFPQDVLNKDNIKNHLDKNIFTDEVEFYLTAINISDVPAKDVKLWVRACEGCTWVSAPPEFGQPDPEISFDRSASVGEMLANVPFSKWKFKLKIPEFPRYKSLEFGAYVACENCAPVDWNRPQRLTISEPNTPFRLRQSPSISYIPEPVPK